MTRIGLLSDTHTYWDEKFHKYFMECDEIWHAGDIGSETLIKKLAEIKPVRAVYGNIDGQNIRMDFPKVAVFTIEKVKVLMTHKGGYPGKYNPEIKPIINSEKPNLFISGHSHILKVMFDKKLNCLHINPGAAGKTGFHKVRTLVRFSIEQDKIKDLEVIELE